MLQEQKAGLSPGNIATLQGVAQAGIPLGIGALAGGSASNLLGRPAKNIAGGAAGLAGYGNYW